MNYLITLMGGQRGYDSKGLNGFFKILLSNYTSTGQYSAIIKLKYCVSYIGKNLVYRTIYVSEVFEQILV